MAFRTWVKWGAEAHMLLESLALVVAPPLLFHFVSRLEWEQSWKLTGVLLQLGGVILAFLGIEDTARNFHTDTILKVAKGWWARRPSHVHHLQGDDLSVAAGIATSAVTATATADVAEPTTDQRLLKLETDLQALREEQHKMAAKLAATRRALNERLTRDKAALEELKTKVEGHIAGDLGVVYLAWGWLVAGTGIAIGLDLKELAPTLGL